VAVALTIDITDHASAMLGRLRQRMAPERMNKVIGASVARLVKDRLFARDAQPNKSGWASQHFYSGAAKATTWTADASGAIISINKQGFRQRVEGGVIKPVNVKYLTIPACAAAYGKRAREFGNLKMQWGKRKDGTIGPVALVALEGGATQKKFRGRNDTVHERAIAQGKGSKKGDVLYWLVREVHQAADDTILPTDAEIINAAIDGLEGAFTE